jgi:hypothetical protein
MADGRFPTASERLFHNHVSYIDQEKKVKHLAPARIGKGTKISRRADASKTLQNEIDTQGLELISLLI